MERWTDKWLEIHYQETQAQIAKLAIQKAYRRHEWWEEQKPKDEWHEEQEQPGV